MGTQTVLFCTGLSGSGKSYFIKNILPTGAFYNLKSATTRPMREGEADGREYYFRDEAYFEKENFATKLFVNEKFWVPGQPKWLYGVPEFEIWNHWGQSFTYDVIEPKYIRQMINWFNLYDILSTYDFRILWFTPPVNNFEIAKKRQNMPNDMAVRTANTCNLEDFHAVGLKPDHTVTCNPQNLIMDNSLRKWLNNISRER